MKKYFGNLGWGGDRPPVLETSATRSGKLPIWIF